jgi:c-di-GMP-binding flagellar brake protein YcgR
MVDLLNVFRAYQVQVFREPEKQTVDLYSVVSVAQGQIVLEAPTSQLRYGPPPIGDALYMESAQPEAIYRTRARVVGVSHGDFLSITVHPEGDVERIQRRKALRVHVNLPVRIIDPTPNAFVERMDVMTRDLSANGFKTVCPHPLRVECRVNIILALGDETNHLGSRAAVVRCRPTLDARFETALQFIKLAEREQERITTTLMRAVKERINL